MPNIYPFRQFGQYESFYPYYLPSYYANYYPRSFEKYYYEPRVTVTAGLIEEKTQKRIPTILWVVLSFIVVYFLLKAR